MKDGNAHLPHKTWPVSSGFLVETRSPTPFNPEDSMHFIEVCYDYSVTLTSCKYANLGERRGK